MTEQATQSIQVNRPRCPYCHDDIQPEVEKSGCSQCMAWFHTDCWDEHGGCTSCVTPDDSPRGTTSNQHSPPSTSSPPSIHSAFGFSLLTAEHKAIAHKAALRNGFLTFCILAPIIIVVNFLTLFLAQTETDVIILLYIYILALAFITMVYSLTRQRQLKIELGKIVAGPNKPGKEKDLKKADPHG